MEEKKMRELNLDEMDKISGGGKDIQDNVEYWVKDHPCPKCGVKGAHFYKLIYHASFYAQIECRKCGKRYKVYK